MRLDLPFIAALTAFVVGFVAFWSNPHRRINQVFLTLSLHAASWLICLGLAVKGGAYGQLWMRTTSAVGAFIPLHLWFIKESIVHGDEPWRMAVPRCWPWALACAMLASLTPTEWYVATASSRELHGFGWGYYAYIVGSIAMYLALSGQTVRQARKRTGVHRIELTIVVLGGSVAVGTVLLLMALRALLAQPWLIQLQPIAVLVFYTGTVVAITTSRIFDARQIFLVGLQRIMLVVVIAGFAFIVFSTLKLVQLPDVLAFVLMIALVLWFASSLSSWFDRMFHFYPQATAARQAAFAVAGKETRLENLERAFLAVLKGWGQSEQALLVHGGIKGSLRGGRLELSSDGPVANTMQQLRWATPERLMRERSTPERLEVGRFLQEHALGVLVIGEGPTLKVLVGVGIAASRRPFTYPQVTQLMELASIIESALERAHFSLRVQHTEQLATIGLLGASLAHEIRNPLVTIKTFVQLLPQHHQDPAFREKFFRLIGSEVNRIDRLTEQLLDLASPRTYVAETIELHPVLRTSLDLVAAKATDKNIEFLTDFGANPDRAYTDASAAKQVMLNLCFNAIQAVESRSGLRWVKISTRNVATGIEMAVSDCGPGVAPEIRPRLFQPFQTTKSSGFGLGLAICSDILTNLNATIAVDPPAPGQGATFRVIFPCQP